MYEIKGTPIRRLLSMGKTSPLQTPVHFFCRGMLHGIPLPSCRLGRAWVFNGFGYSRLVAPHQTPLRIKAL